MTNRNACGTVLSRRRHAQLARQLIDLCGGLDESATACRVGKTQLSDYQNPNGDGFMPADVMVDLEAYCGSSTYSSALAAERPSDVLPECFIKEAHELVDAVAKVLPLALNVQNNLNCPKARAALDEVVGRAIKEARDLSTNVVTLREARQ